MNIRLAFNTCVIAVRKQSDFFLVAFGAGVSVTLAWLCLSKMGSVSSGLLLGLMILVFLVCAPIAASSTFATVGMVLMYIKDFIVFLIDKLKQFVTSRQPNTTTTTTTTTAGSAGIQMERVRDPNPARTYFKSIPVTSREESESSTNHETITIDPSPPSKRDDDSNQQARVNTPESEPNPAQSV